MLLLGMSLKRLREHQRDTAAANAAAKVTASPVLAPLNAATPAAAAPAPAQQQQRQRQQSWFAWLLGLPVGAGVPRAPPPIRTDLLAIDRYSLAANRIP